jgi:tetratricopeptide (TPR) repeat protein
MGEASLIAAALLTHAAMLSRVGDEQGAREGIAGALRRAESVEDSTLICLAYTQAAEIDIASGEFLTALSGLHVAFGLGRAKRLTSPKAHALAAVGCAYVFNDREALTLLGRAQLLHERVGDSIGLGKVYNNFGVIHHVQGRLVNAIPFYERALDLLSAGGDLVTLLGVLNNNVRAFEMHYMDGPASHFRDAMESLSSALEEPGLTRFGDMTVLTKPAGRPPADAVFADTLFAADPVILQPTAQPVSFLEAG